jgi:hypothetical protein
VAARARATAARAKGGEGEGGGGEGEGGGGEGEGEGDGGGDGGEGDEGDEVAARVHTFSPQEIIRALHRHTEHVRRAPQGRNKAHRHAAPVF